MTKSVKYGRVASSIAPVASVMVDVPLPHLDRPFDFLVPSELDESTQLGSRVRVRFAGRLVDGHVLARSDASEHVGKLAFIERVVGGAPLLTAETIALVRAVADRWGGTFADVVRLAVPPRHARAETAAAMSERLVAFGEPPAALREPPVALGEPPAALREPHPRPPDSAAQDLDAGWGRYNGGREFVSRLRAGESPRVAWAALAGEDWPTRLAELALAAFVAGRGTILIVPDARDLQRLDAAMTTVLGNGRHVALSADLGPAERYKRWWAVRTGAVRVVIGTRAAAYAPVENLGLVGIWDDGDDLHVEPRAPYPHTRDVLVLRTTQLHGALVIGGFSQSTETAFLIERRWVDYLGADRATVRQSAPRVSASGDDFELARDPAARTARLPDQALRVARTALQAGDPVLIQVPRRGYLPSVSCARDRTPARCTHCGGPLALSQAKAVPECRWCGRPATNWHCPECGGTSLRAGIVGAGRTAEELGRAFPGYPIRISSGDQVLSSVPSSAALVVATAGAEPVTQSGYGAALLVDGWVPLSRPELSAGEEALRRWINAAALVHSKGEVVIMADSGLVVVQALIRWAPSGYAERELADRKSLNFPPYSRLASVTGDPAAVAELAASMDLPDGAEVIGSVTVSSPPGSERDSVVERMILRAPRAVGTDLAVALHRAAAGRSARRTAAPVRIQLDPTELF